MSGKVKSDILLGEATRSSARAGTPAGETDRSKLEGELRRRLAESCFPGGRLPPERILAQQLGVGRRGLRAALRVLEQEGHIWRRQGLGTFVGEAPEIVHSQFHRPTELARMASPLALMETRLIVEPTTARLAAMRATQTQIDDLKLTIEHTFEARTAQEYEARDASFHRMIADVASNVLLLATLDLLSEVRREARWGQMRSTHFSTERLSLLRSEHTAILDAIIDRDPARAENEMRRHLRGVAIRLVGIDPLPPLVISDQAD